MITKAIHSVTISSAEVGEAVVSACDSTQREVLIAMANAVDQIGRDGGSWPMQCRYIVDGFYREGLSQSDRVRIASMLDCLVDHLKDAS
jgi:hypothetical protein